MKEAFNAVQDALKITMATTAQELSAVEFNSKDLFFNKDRSMSLYLGDFAQSVNYLPLLTVTLVEIRNDEDDTYETEIEGSDDDYTIDLIRNAIHFNYRLSRSGYKNVKITGTYGVVADPLTDLPEKYKKYIAYLAAIKGMTYAVGGGFSESKSVDAGILSVRKDEFSSTSSATYERLQNDLKDHLNSYGLSKKRVSISIG